MFSLSVEQALDIWHDLEKCYYGENNFGGETAEIYAYRLLPSRPGADNGFYLDEADRALRAKEAADNLRPILDKFAQVRKDARILIEGRPLEKGLLPFLHRIHVTIHKR